MVTFSSTDHSLFLLCFKLLLVFAVQKILQLKVVSSENYDRLNVVIVNLFYFCVAVLRSTVFCNFVEMLCCIKYKFIFGQYCLNKLDLQCI
jgi:hypothetical protein